MYTGHICSIYWISWFRLDWACCILSSGQNFLLQILMFTYPLLLSGPVHLKSSPGFCTEQVHSGGCQLCLERKIIQPSMMMLASNFSRTNYVVLAFGTPLSVLKMQKSAWEYRAYRYYPSVDKLSSEFPADSSKRETNLSFLVGVVQLVCWHANVSICSNVHSGAAALSASIMLLRFSLASSSFTLRKSLFLSDDRLHSRMHSVRWYLLITMPSGLQFQKRFS